MKPKWLLESDLFEEDLPRLVAEIKRQGFEVKVMSSTIADVYASLPNFLDFYKPEDCVIYYGPLELGYRIRREAKWVPGIFCSTENYECTNYYPKFGDYLLNSNYMMIPFGDLLRQKEFLYEKLGQKDSIFIRPNKGTKVFTGQLVYKEKFEDDLKFFQMYNLDDKELCIVAEPRNIKFEWRFVVVDNKVVTGSLYKPLQIGPKDSDCLESYREALVYAQNVLSDIDYNPDKAWTLDICKTFAGNHYVLEVGGFSCAGLYKCKVEPIVREVSRVALEEWKEYYE